MSLLHAINTGTKLLYLCLDKPVSVSAVVRLFFVLILKLHRLLSQFDIRVSMHR